MYLPAPLIDEHYFLSQIRNSEPAMLYIEQSNVDYYLYFLLIINTTLYLDLVLWCHSLNFLYYISSIMLTTLDIDHYLCATIVDKNAYCATRAARLTDDGRVICLNHMLI